MGETAERLALRSGPIDNRYLFDEFLGRAANSPLVADDTFFLLEQRLAPQTAGKSVERLEDIAQATPTLPERHALQSLAVVELIRAAIPPEQKQVFARKVQSVLEGLTALGTDKGETAAAKPRYRLSPSARARRTGNLVLVN